jgi:hypothetical protein
MSLIYAGSSESLAPEDNPEEDRHNYKLCRHFETSNRSNFRDIIGNLPYHYWRLATGKREHV